MKLKVIAQDILGNRYEEKGFHYKHTMMLTEEQMLKLLPSKPIAKLTMLRETPHFIFKDKRGIFHLAN